MERILVEIDQTIKLAIKEKKTNCFYKLRVAWTNEECQMIRSSLHTRNIKSRIYRGGRDIMHTPLDPCCCFFYPICCCFRCLSTNQHDFMFPMEELQLDWKEHFLNLKRSRQQARNLLEPILHTSVTQLTLDYISWQVI